MADASIQAFAATLRGELVRPGDASYDDTRKVYNGMHDRRPALIVLAAGVADVIAAVRFARERELVLAVRGGGHSAPGFGTCDGGLVVDLRRMRGVRVDPERRAVRVASVTDRGVVIGEGLSGNERVVESAGAFLNPGERVRPERRQAARR